MLRNGLEPWHVILVVVVVALLFGSKKLPDAARGLGRSMRIFKSEVKAMKSMEDDDTRTAPVTADAAPFSTAPTAPVTTAPKAATEATERKSATAH
ncbi:Sec-independent protein translocase subunit TatA [Streptomyces sp. NBC_01497]|uniref:Sec-independent protein translocase subunit TatA n=1 Tax=Streptomyces sp. NBC_01497 TaxID=2903885 RepID=UPI002E3672DE|nr:Sec-independent protein translocase subunit TatA [Streptomyces sp. NBC_01497]